MKITEILEATDLPYAYSHFKGRTKPPSPPYIVYTGTGQTNFVADNTIYHTTNSYQLEYYFTKKNEKKEVAIEKLILEAGLIYEKSEDVYIEDEDVFVIYYDISY